MTISLKFQGKEVSWKNLVVWTYFLLKMFDGFKNFKYVDVSYLLNLLFSGCQLTDQELYNFG